MPATVKYNNQPSLASSIVSIAAKLLFFQQLYNFRPAARQSYDQYERAKLAAHSAKSRWQFLRDCKAEQVLPKSMQHLKRYNSSGHPFPQQQEAILRDQIASAHREKQQKFAHLHHCKRTFRNNCPRQSLYLHGLSLAHEVAKDIDKTTSWKHSDKLRNLCNKSPWASAAQTDSVVNLSSHTPSPLELQLLGLGLAFSLPPRKESVLDVLVALQDLQSKARDIAAELNTIKGYALTGLCDLTNPLGTLPRRLEQAKHSLQRNAGIIILKADKGSKVCILDKDAYILAGEEMLADPNVYVPLTKSPLRTEQASFNRRLKRTFKKMQVCMPKRFLAYLPTLPFMKLSPKIHKPNLCFRPIISQSKAFTKPLAQHLANILNPLLGTFSSAHLANSKELKQRLQDEADPNLPFLSIDVESLFTNVPIEPLLQFLYRKYHEGMVPLPAGYTIEGVLDLIRLCIDSTVFSFNGKYYRQKQGVSMGSPLAPILACLYMEYFETELRHNIQGPQPSFWVRYIDDILLQWAGSLDEFNIYLNELTNIEDLIKLQTEWETTDPAQPGHSTMPFLDLLIQRSPSGFSFSVYRKPTATDLYTHYYSSHSLSTKKGVLIGLFLRGLNLCSPEHLPNEIKHIRTAFKRLRYPQYVINEALSTAKRRFQNPTPRERPKSKYHLSLVNFSSLEPIRQPLKNLGVSTSFSSCNTLGNQLSHTGPLRPHDSELPGVYCVGCKQCPSKYYGETGVSLAIRMAGHRSDIRYAKDSNALFAHMRDNPGHSFDLKGAKLIYTSNQKSNRQLVESSLIATTANCNLKPGDYPVCRITAPVVLNSVKLADCSTFNVPEPTSNPTSITGLPTNLPLVVPTPPAITTMQLDSPLVTSNLTQAFSNLTTSSSSQHQISSNTVLPSTSSTPIARHTRSHHLSVAVSSVDISPLVQSQARALPLTYYSHSTLRPATQYTDSPAIRKVQNNVLLSQCHSPKATTGTIRKRRFVCNHPTSPFARSPAVKRLRSRNIPY